MPPSGTLKYVSNYRQDVGEFHKFLGPSFLDMFDVADKQYALVVPNMSNVYKALDSFDLYNPGDFIKDLDFQFGFMFLGSQYEDVFADCVASNEEVASYVDWTKSPGFPGNYMGFQTKRNLSQSDSYNLSEYVVDPTTTLPIYAICGKKEMRLLQECIDGKVRVYMIPPLHLLLLQLKYGKRISERLKAYKWSAYGFNPYSGGVDGLAHKLLSKPIRLFYDVSGWDKYLPLLPAVFAVIKAVVFKSMSQLQQKEFLWVIKHTLEFVLKFPDGHCYRKPYGNASGSGTTTRDNILAHIIIVASLLHKCYRLKMGHAPSRQLVADQIVFLFGDDSIISCDDEFSFILDENLVQEHFALFGMKLKFLHGGINYPLEKMQFLGFHFIKKDNMWYPLFNTARLASTLVYQGVSDATREAYVCKSFILMMMAFPSPEFALFKGCYLSVLDHLTLPLTPVEESFKSYRSLKDDDFVSIYQGLEASLGNLFFLSLLDGWRNKEALLNGRNRSIKTDSNESSPYVGRISGKTCSVKSWSAVVNHCCGSLA